MRFKGRQEAINIDTTLTPEEAQAEAPFAEQPVERAQQREQYVGQEPRLTLDFG